MCLPNPEGLTCKCPSGHSLANLSKCVEAAPCSELSRSCKDGQKCVSMEQVCDGHADWMDLMS